MHLHATLLSAVGVALPSRVGVDGEDLLPVLAGKKPVRERTFFWRLQRPGETFGQKAVRRGRWKFVKDRGVELLFDLEKDIGERRTLAYGHPETVRELRQALAGWEAGLPAVGR
jgi:arylsulfatase A-like enzyme